MAQQSVKYATTAGSANAVAWGNVSGKPSAYTPSAHTHDDRYYTEAEVKNLIDSTKYQYKIINPQITSGFANLILDGNHFVISAYCSGHVLIPFTVNGSWYALALDGSGNVETTGTLSGTTVVYY